MKKTGQILKENREKQGMSTSEVASLIKINTKIVVAIEEGDPENLPAKTFLRGFVQSYATILKLDVHEVLTTFHEEMGSTKPKSAVRDQKNREAELKSAADSPIDYPDKSLLIKMLWAAAIVGLGFLIFILAKTVEKYEQETQTDPTEIAEAIPTKDSSEEKKELNQRDQVKATPRPTPIQPGDQEDEEERASDKSTEVTAATVESTPEATPEPTPTPTPTPEATPEPTPTPTPTPEATPDEETKKESQAKEEVILEAFAAITVSYAFDDQKEFKTTKLQADEIRILKAKKTIRLKISDGGSLNVTFNGKDTGVPGSLGEPIELQFPKE